MSQNRRKVAFSCKKKKDQLALKRQMKTSQKYLKTTRDDNDDDGETTEDTELTVRKLMDQPIHRDAGGFGGGGGAARHKNINRYNLQFYQESKKELEQLKLEAYKPLVIATTLDREIDGKYFVNCDFPTRPPWRPGVDKATLEMNENRAFREYVERIQKSNRRELSLFELNLETWRQLWRVLEMSDILLIIVDVRFSTLMFPPSLYDYILNTLKKRAILVLNKVDLVAPEAVVAWRHYFMETYANLPVALFASLAKKPRGGAVRGNRMSVRRSMEGVHNIFKACQGIVPADRADLTTWEQKILDDMRQDNVFVEETNTDDDPGNKRGGEATHEEPEEQQQQPQTAYRDGILTLGCIGFPNVGKSSLINALKGRKVVSVSRTPGHTKHFQTIFLTHSVRLCDSPGLVFPSATPKHLQVLIGSFPISQLQVPYRSLKFLSEHLNVTQLLRLHLPEDYDEWSAAAVADAWALKRGFLTAKAARPDRYRSANYLLRMCLAGQQQIVLQFYPPGFADRKEFWSSHPELAEVLKFKQPAEEVVEEDKEDTSSLNSDSGDSEGESSSNDETAADEETESRGATGSGFKPYKNTFALLEDDN